MAQQQVEFDLQHSNTTVLSLENNVQELLQRFAFPDGFTLLLYHCIELCNTSERLPSALQYLHVVQEPMYKCAIAVYHFDMIVTHLLSSLCFFMQQQKTIPHVDQIHWKKITTLGMYAGCDRFSHA